MGGGTQYNILCNWCKLVQMGGGTQYNNYADCNWQMRGGTQYNNSFVMQLVQMRGEYMQYNIRLNICSLCRWGVEHSTILILCNLCKLVQMRSGMQYNNSFVMQLGRRGWNSIIFIYYTVCTGKYHESVAVLSRVPQARVTIRLQMSDISQYRLYNTFIMFPDPAAYRGTAW